MISAIRLALRGAATTPALSMFLVIVIAGLSYLGVAAPMMLEQGRTATIQNATAALPQISRWLTATAPGLPSFDSSADPEAGVWGSALSTIDASRRQQPPALRALLGEPRLMMAIDPQFSIDPDPARTDPVPINKIALVSEVGFESRIAVVEGRLPELTDPAVTVEVALTTEVAEQLAWPVGTERLWDGRTLLLTGTVAAIDPDTPDWAFIPGSLRPVLEVSSTGDQILVGAAFMHVDEVAALEDRVRDVKVTSWIPLDTDQITAASAAAVAAQLRLLTADPIELPMATDSFYNRGLSFSSGLPRVIGDGVTRGQAMTAVVAVAAVGPVAVAIVVLALVTRLIGVRRVGPVRVLRARGASTVRLIVLLGGEGAALGVLGAVIGSSTAAVESGLLAGWVLLIPALLAAVPALVLPWGVLTDAERHQRQDLGVTARRGSPRLIAELLFLALTVVLVALIAARPGGADADPLLLALPVLLGASASILCLRMLPPLLLLAERRGRGRASLTALLGPARARRDPLVRAAPVLAVVIGLGVAVFSVAFASTVTSGIQRSAVMDVGADVRVDASYITEDAAERVAQLEGVAQMAALQGDSAVEAETASENQRAHVYTIDTAEFARMQQGLPAALPLPASLAEPADGDRVPVVASQTLLERLGVDASGDLDEIGLEVGGREVHVIAVAPAQVPFGTAEQWVIVDTENARALGQRNIGLSQLYLSVGPNVDADEVGAAAVREVAGDAVFTTPARTAAVHEQDPAFSVVQGALLAASGIVAVLLAVAVVAMLVLGAVPRARMLAILRALGHPSRGEGRLVTWEVAPALLLALPFGAGVGISMAWLVIPQLDLRGFVGGPTQPPVELGGMWPVIVVVGFALVSAIAVIAATALASRLGTATAVRDGDEREQ
ncbi:ABC transporter permease [Microbacterium sp. NPDC089321]|uniref:ABC transporter permease n=1 Tax=Microbacterium sp. NPDC089321 TaxID=3155183 RepID=UPI003414CE29